MSVRSLHDLTFEEMQERLLRDGVRPVHALKLFQSLHQECDAAPDLREDFPPPLRRWLRDSAVELPAVGLRQVQEIASGDGWTRKFLLALRDGQQVEAVLMGFPGRFTACISTQAGCAMGCVFCATGQMGLVRNLQAGEIVGQILHVARRLREVHGERIRNLVLMGMGEPLHNYGPVMKALEIATDTRGMNIGPARVSISTVGHVPGIRLLARHPRRYRLAVSLHAATDEERSALLPINRRWPLAELLDACREYNALTKRRIFFAWTLIAGRNDAEEHAAQLGSLLQGMDAHVNLIPLNPTSGFDADCPSDSTMAAFQRVLQNAGIPSTVRQRRGIDVHAGCGQLRSHHTGRSGERTEDIQFPRSAKSGASR